MEKRTLNDIKDFWAWRDEVLLDENYDRPAGEDLPKAYPCEVVWFRQDETSSFKDSIYYLFVYVQEILGL